MIQEALDKDYTAHGITLHHGTTIYDNPNAYWSYCYTAYQITFYPLQWPQV
jgi:hypothetical protein